MATCERLAHECNAFLVYQGVNGMRIWYYEGKNPLAIIQRSAKAVNVRRGDHLVFPSTERREVWAKEQMDNAEAMARRRSEAKRVNLEHRTALKVGDILYCTWGWEQTNVEFVQVVEVLPSGKTCKVREICSRIEETEAMQGNAWPLKDNFKGPEHLFRPRVGDCGNIGYRHFSPMGEKVWIGCSWYA